MTNYIAQQLIMALIFGCAATVVSYLAAEAGIIYIAGATAMGVGAYVFALSTVVWRVSSSIGLMLSLLAGIFFGLLNYLLTRRLTQNYLAIMTLAIAVIGNGIMLNWQTVTRGAMGVTGIPVIMGSNIYSLTVLSAASIALCVIAWRLPLTIFGLRVRACRDDEMLSAAMMLRPSEIRCALLVVSSVVFCLIGALYGSYLQIVDPSSFALNESIAVLAMAVVIPIAPAVRGVIGAATFVAMPDVLWFAGIQSATGAHIRHLLFGLLLVISLLRRERSTVL